MRPRVHQLDPESNDPATVLAVGTDGIPQWVALSVPTLVLEAGDDATDVPAATPVRSLIFFKA